MKSIKFCIQRGSGNRLPYGLLNNSKPDRFNVLTILGDLIEVTKGLPCKENFQRMESAFQQAFGVSCYDEAEVLDCFNKMDRLREWITGKIPFLFSQFEVVRSFFEITFSVTTTWKRSISDSNICSFPPQQHGFTNIEKVLGNNVDEERCYIYCCNSMIDIPFSILHYLLMNDYEFRDCEHCGKYFATQSFKRKYCTRKSPYPAETYEKLSCEAAVDSLMKKIKKRRKSIIVYLDNHYPKARIPFLEEFDRYNRYDSIEKKFPRSWETLEMLEAITNKEYIKKTWYHKEYK